MKTNLKITASAMLLPFLGSVFISSCGGEDSDEGPGRTRNNQIAIIGDRWIAPTDGQNNFCRYSEMRVEFNNEAVCGIDDISPYIALFKTETGEDFTSDDNIKMGPSGPRKGGAAGTCVFFLYPAQALEANTSYAVGFLNAPNGLPLDGKLIQFRTDSNSNCGDADFTVASSGFAGFSSSEAQTTNIDAYGSYVNGDLVYDPQLLAQNGINLGVDFLKGLLGFGQASGTVRIITFTRDVDEDSLVTGAMQVFKITAGVAGATKPLEPQSIAQSCPGRGLSGSLLQDSCLQYYRSSTGVLDKKRIVLYEPTTYSWGTGTYLFLVSNATKSTKGRYLYGRDSSGRLQPYLSAYQTFRK